MRTARFHLRLAIIALVPVLLCSLDTLPARAAGLPLPNEVASGLPSGQTQVLTASRNALLARRAAILGKLAAHNQQCSSVVEGSSTGTACRAARSALQSEIQQYSGAVDAFNREQTATTELRHSRPAYFISNVTGAIRLASYGGDTSARLGRASPLDRRIRWVYLTLFWSKDAKIFIRLANRHQVIPSATLTEAKNPYSYSFRNAVVKGYTLLPPGNSNDGPLITLGISDWIPRCRIKNGSLPGLFFGVC